MKTIWRITLSLTFENEADRNTWYDKLKTGAASIKATTVAPTSIRIEKDDYYTTSPISENL